MSHTKLGKEIVKFGYMKSLKKSLLWKFYFLEDVDIDSLLVSKEISSCQKNYKYFIDSLWDA